MFAIQNVHVATGYRCRTMSSDIRYFCDISIYIREYYTAYSIILIDDTL